MSTFSIITVTRNNLAGLKKTGDSVQNQTCRDFEWIVVDGASTDGSASWLKTASAHWISEPDDGIYDAMNTGIRLVSGDFLIFMNAGDVFAEPESLTKILRAIAASPARPDFIYGDSLETSDRSIIAKPARDCSKIKCGMPTHHQAMLYRREAVGDLRFDTKYKIAADYKFTAQFLQKIGNTLCLGFPVCVFDSGGISQQRVRQGRNEMFRVRRELGLCGLIENINFYAVQTLIMALRRLFPSVYWKLRQSCGNSANGPEPVKNLRQENQV